MDKLISVFTVCVCGMVGLCFSCKHESDGMVKLFTEDALVDSWKYLAEYSHRYNNLVFCLLIVVLCEWNKNYDSNVKRMVDDGLLHLDRDE